MAAQQNIQTIIFIEKSTGRPVTLPSMKRSL